MSKLSPYENLEAKAFWRSGVVEAEGFPPQDIYKAKFPVTKDMRILTAGSCFAQHVGRALRDNGYSVIDTEPMPASCPIDLQRQFGYGLYSARYGNIYSVRQFLQLIQEAYGHFEPSDWIWQRDNRFFDALRPSVEPEGFATEALVKRARQPHLNAVRQALEQADVVIFTLGLTEGWMHIDSGTVYPTAPGTIANRMDETKFRFHNFRHAEIRTDFEAIHALLKLKSPHLKFLLTVSPVPLTATASGQHVLPATVYSKSVLRAVCGELVEDYDDIDYFPSYEIVASHPSKARYFEDNLRSVHPNGVAEVMQCFLRAHSGVQAQNPAPIQALRAKTEDSDEGDLICEDLLLEAFRK
jgi:hypothetical protein